MFQLLQYINKDSIILSFWNGLGFVTIVVITSIFLKLDFDKLREAESFKNAVKFFVRIAIVLILIEFFTSFLMYTY